MQHRQNGASQEVAAAKAGISVRSGRRIETSTQKPRVNTERQWRTREDPLEAVWETELLPLLQAKPDLTIYDYLDTGLPMLERMFRKREKGCKAMGYQFSAVRQMRLL